MFENVPLAPPDSILGITEAFNKDPNPEKINLSVGIYKDGTGKTPILRSVKAAEERLLKTEGSKAYLPIDGYPQFRTAVIELIFGTESEIVKSGRALAAQTPSGTGSLRVAADYLKKLHPAAKIWMTTPTWDNHPHVFGSAGHTIQNFPYFDAKKNGLAFKEMITELQKIPAGDVVLLHGCCHNPSGVDPSLEEWKEIAEVLSSRGAIPLVDFAYQGLGTGISEDGAGLYALAAKCPELLVCSSYSKNFGLYNERVGAFTIVAKNKEQAASVMSNVKAVIRANYSNPPFHGGAIVATVLADSELRADWEKELTEMRDRINGMRTLFADSLRKSGIDRDFSFVEQQKGMFSFSGLTKQQVERLRDEFSIYVVGSGRINVAGMTEMNMPRLCSAIKTVLEG